MNPNENPTPAFEEESPRGFTIRDALYILFRHMGKMAVFFVVVLTGGLLSLLMLPDQYQSEAQIFIKGGRNALTKDSQISVPMVESKVMDEITIMRGRILAEKVVAQIGADRILSQKPTRHRLVEPLIAWFQGSVSEESPEKVQASEEVKNRYATKYIMSNLELRQSRGGSSVIQATFTALEPALAQEVLENLLEFYQERHVKVFEAAVSPEFFEQETSKTLTVLDAKEKEIEVFRRKHNIVSMEIQKTQLLELINNLRSGISNVRADINASMAKIEVYEKELAPYMEDAQGDDGTSQTLTEEARAASSVSSSNPLVLDLRRQLMNLRIEEKKTAQLYHENSRELKNIRAEISVREEALAAELESMKVVRKVNNGVTARVVRQVGPVDTTRRQIALLLTTARANLKSQESNEKDLQAELPDLEKSLSSLLGIESALVHLESEEAVHRAKYEQFRANFERSKFARAMDRDMVTNVTILQEATFPHEPMKSNKRRNAALVLFTAFFGSLGLAAALEYMNQTFKTQQDVEKHLGLPVLATISHKDYKSCT